MLSKCVYSYISSWAIYNNYDVNVFFDKVVKNLNLNNITCKPIPIINDELAPIEWYYSLFTKKELQNVLEKHDIPLPNQSLPSF